MQAVTYSFQIKALPPKVLIVVKVYTSNYLVAEQCTQDTKYV